MRIQFLWFLCTLRLWLKLTSQKKRVGEKNIINKKICKSKYVKEKNFAIYSSVTDWLKLVNEYKQAIILKNCGFRLLKPYYFLNKNSAINNVHISYFVRIPFFE